MAAREWKGRRKLTIHEILSMIEEEDSCGKSDSDVEESCATGHDARDVPVPETNVEKQQMQILDANEGQSQPDLAVGCVGQIEDQSEIQPEAETEEITIEGGQEHERHHENVAVAVGIEDENHDNENNVSE